MVELLPVSNRARNYRHGYKTAGKYSPEYSIWMNLRARCNNPKNNRYDRYGARGIRVCDRWMDDFLNFLEDMGRRPSADHQIDRIDNDGDYCPENCRWATRAEQCRNRSTSRFLEFGGKRMTLAEWSEATGIGVSTLSWRVQRGWSDQRALSQPVRGHASKTGEECKPADIYRSFPAHLEKR